MINSRSRHRPATAGDLTAIQQIERAAGHAFRSVGMDSVADDEPIDVEQFGHFLDGGGAWVAVDDQDQPLAYVLLERLDDAAHIEQVTVHPDAAGQRIGAGLIDLADRWGADRGLTAITLTTFSDVGWNAPYYARLGFVVLDRDPNGPDPDSPDPDSPDPDSPDPIGPELRGRIAAEAAAGLSRWPRVAMRRPVTPAAG